MVMVLKGHMIFERSSCLSWLEVSVNISKCINLWRLFGFDTILSYEGVPVLHDGHVFILVNVGSNNVTFPGFYGKGVMLSVQCYSEATKILENVSLGLEGEKKKVHGLGY